MKKFLYPRLIVSAFLMSLCVNSSFSQTIYNIYGKASSYIEDKTFYDFDGTPLMHLSKENVYMFDGQHIGFFVNSIFYNLQGLIVGFEKGAVSMVTEQDPPKAPRAPLPPRAPLEPAPPRPPLQMRLASASPSEQSNYNGKVNETPILATDNNNVLNYRGNAALAGVASDESINLSESNTAVSNLAYSTMQYNKRKLELAYKAKPFIEKAWYYYDKNDLQNAEYNANQAISIAGNFHFVANYLLGLIYRDKDQYQIAISYLDLAINQNKKEGNYYAVRGYCYYKLGNKQVAKNDFKIGKRKGSESASYFLSSLIFNDKPH